MDYKWWLSGESLYTIRMRLPSIIYIMLQLQKNDYECKHASNDWGENTRRRNAKLNI